MVVTVSSSGGLGSTGLVQVSQHISRYTGSGQLPPRRTRVVACLFSKAG